MPSLKTFQIEFDRLNAIFAPGELVTGNVITDVTSEKNVRGMYVRAKGEANVTWTVSRTEKDSRGHTHTVTDHYTANEHYFTLTSTLIGQQGGDTRIQIPMGYHKYPFNFQLPHNIPCSFEHKYGHIRYTIKAVIDRPWKFDHECKAAFTVISTLDLNSYQEQCYGVNDDIHKNFCYLCCFDGGSIKAEIRVPYSGYVSGQSIDTTICYDNASDSVDVTKVSTKLQRCLKFHARAPSSTTKTDETEIVADRIERLFNRKEEIVSKLSIPSTPPSNLQFCGIIDLEYKLDVTIHVSGMHFKIAKRYPILIGTIPLRCSSFVPSIPSMGQSVPLTTPLINHTQHEHVPMLMPMPMPMSVPMPMPMPMPTSTSNIVPVPTAPYPTDPLPTGGSYGALQSTQSIGFVNPNQHNPSSSQWAIPPPTYEECMSQAGNIKDHNESNHVYGADQPFAPKYPVFNFPTPSVPKQ